MFPMSPLSSWAMIGLMVTITITLVLLALDKLDEEFWEDLDK